MTALLQTHGLTRVLAAAVPVTLVKDISITVEPGEFVAITGPSGSGKSSLLYLLGLLDQPTSGTLAIGGRQTVPMNESQRTRTRLTMLGFVFQFHFLLPELSIRQNVELPMRKRGELSRQQTQRQAEKLLDSLGMLRHVDKLPEQLSGGERQRVAVARALANDPPIVLADEPTGSLDSANSRQVFGILRDLVQDRGKTVIAVTHDVEMADRMDRRIHLMDGRVVSDERSS
jgi:lipoprotein-releasing system ATP-binding protein